MSSYNLMSSWCQLKYTIMSLGVLEPILVRDGWLHALQINQLSQSDDTALLS